MEPDPPPHHLVQAGQDRRQLLQTGAQGFLALPMNVLSMTRDMIINNGWHIEHVLMEDLPIEYHNRVARATINPLGTRFYKTRLLGQNLRGEWEGILGPGLMIIRFVAQAEEAYLNWVSSLIGYIYRQTFTDTDLRSVFIDQVVDADTMDLYRHHVYRNWHSGNSIPPVTFDSGSRIYDALLGTEYGKIVFALVLASEHNTLHISRISIWAENTNVQLRFDIELYEADATNALPHSSRLVGIAGPQWPDSMAPSPVLIETSTPSSILTSPVTSPPRNTFPSELFSRLSPFAPDDEDAGEEASSSSSSESSDDEDDDEEEEEEEASDSEDEDEQDETEVDDYDDDSPPTSLERVRQSLPTSSGSSSSTSPSKTSYSPSRTSYSPRHWS